LPPLGLVRVGDDPSPAPDSDRDRAVDVPAGLRRVLGLVAPRGDRLESRTAPFQFAALAQLDGRLSPPRRTQPLLGRAPELDAMVGGGIFAFGGLFVVVRAFVVAGRFYDSNPARQRLGHRGSLVLLLDRRAAGRQGEKSAMARRLRRA